MTSYISLQYNIPIPVASVAGRKPKYPFMRMQVGDSFFAPLVSNLNTNAWTTATGFKFSIRRTTEAGVTGMRCWRIA